MSYFEDSNVAKFLVFWLKTCMKPVTTHWLSFLLILWIRNGGEDSFLLKQDEKTLSTFTQIKCCLFKLICSVIDSSFNFKLHEKLSNNLFKLFILFLRQLLICEFIWDRSLWKSNKGIQRRVWLRDLNFQRKSKCLFNCET